MENFKAHIRCICALWDIEGARPVMIFKGWRSWQEGEGRVWDARGEIL